MTQGRKAYGLTKKNKKDHAHCLKKHKAKANASEECIAGHPAEAKSLDKKLKKPRKNK